MCHSPSGFRRLPELFWRDGLGAGAGLVSDDDLNVDRKADKEDENYGEGVGKGSHA